MQLSLVLAVIGNLATGTCRTSRRRLTSCPNDDPGLCLLHTLQHQSLRCRQGIPHNINRLAHKLNISNLSSLHRMCGRIYLKVLAHFRCNPALMMISQLDGLGLRLAQLSVCLRKRGSAGEVLLAWLVWRCQRSTSSLPFITEELGIDESSPQQHPTRFMDLSYQTSARVTLTGAGPAPSVARSPLVRTSDA
jgi:hypothetical protein